MAGSMKDIKLRIKSVESTMQITKAMELVASSKMRRAKERVEHSRPYFETLHETLTKIAAADPRARNPYLRRDEVKRTLLIVIAGDRGLAGGYNSNVLKQAGAEEGEVLVLPIGKRSAEYFVHHEVPLFTQEVLLAADVSVGECFQLSRQITEGYRKGEYEFWMKVRAKIVSAGPGEVIEVNARDNDKMPNSVMQALAAKEDVTLRIRWNDGEEIVIPSAAALQEKMRMFYPLSYLAKFDFAQTPAKKVK